MTWCIHDLPKHECRVCTPDAGATREALRAAVAKRVQLRRQEHLKAHDRLQRRREEALRLAAGVPIQNAKGRPLFHITHQDNLPSIVAQQGLWAENMRDLLDIEPRRIADQDLKTKRASKSVPTKVGGVVSDYVPFHFWYRSPMLGALYFEKVTGYVEGEEPLVYLVTDSWCIASAGLPYCFTDCHPIASRVAPKFYDSLDDLRRLDWAVITASTWKDSALDPTRGLRKQAEFLVHEFLPWQLITRIGVFSAKTKAVVEQATGTAQHRPAIEIHPNWYYGY